MITEQWERQYVMLAPPFHKMHHNLEDCLMHCRCVDILLKLIYFIRTFSWWQKKGSNNGRMYFCIYCLAEWSQDRKHVDDISHLEWSEIKSRAPGNKSAVWSFMETLHADVSVWATAGYLLHGEWHHLYTFPTDGTKMTLSTDMRLKYFDLHAFPLLYSLLWMDVTVASSHPPQLFPFVF